MAASGSAGAAPSSELAGSLGSGADQSPVVAPLLLPALPRTRLQSGVIKPK
jgi:hypothetical protein